MTASVPPCRDGEHLSQRSEREWYDALVKPLAAFRDELRLAVEAAKDAEAKGWADLVSLWQEKVKARRGSSLEEVNKTVQMRWQRALKTSRLDTSGMGEILSALHKIRTSIPEGAYPSVRRMLYGEEKSTERLAEVLYPDHIKEQETRGLSGCWRLTHLSSDSSAFIVWRVRFDRVFEPFEGPGTWFCMETELPGEAYQAGRRPLVPVSVQGAVHAVASMFFMIGAQQNSRPVMGSFQLPQGSLPADECEHAIGVIQRVGTGGLYAARALLRRISDSHGVDIGSFTIAQAEARGFQDTLDDINTLNHGADEPGGALCLLAKTSRGDF